MFVVSRASTSLSLLFSETIPGLHMRRAQFVSSTSAKEKETHFYVFYINETGLWRLTLRNGLFTNVVSTVLLQESPNFNPFTNMKIFYLRDRQRVIITASCTKEVLVLSHQVEQCRTAVLHRMPNPKNPPFIPRLHIYNCIEYFRPREGDLLIAVSFTERVYFIRIWPDYCEVSKRVKFLHRILRVINFKQEGVIFVCSKEVEEIEGERGEQR